VPRRAEAHGGPANRPNVFDNGSKSSRCPIWWLVPFYSIPKVSSRAPDRCGGMLIAAVSALRGRRHAWRLASMLERPPGTSPSGRSHSGAVLRRDCSTEVMKPVEHRRGMACMAGHAAGLRTSPGGGSRGLSPLPLGHETGQRQHPWACRNIAVQGRLPAWPRAAAASPPARMWRQCSVRHRQCSARHRVRGPGCGLVSGPQRALQAAASRRGPAGAERWLFASTGAPASAIAEHRARHRADQKKPSGEGTSPFSNSGSSPCAFSPSSARAWTCVPSCMAWRTMLVFLVTFLADQK
jgi:hypothetical protein